MKWYRARYRWSGDGVQPVEIERETEHRVFFDDGTWANKRSTYQSFFPTRLEAARWLEEQTAERNKKLALHYQWANEEWRNARAIRIEAELGGEMKPTKPTLNWELNVDCPFCGETFDLSDEDGEVHDYFFSLAIFRNEWAKIEGEDVDCPKCGASVTLGEVEY